MLNAPRLLDLARRQGEEYRNNQPFPHLVIDDFLPEEVAGAAEAHFPTPDRMNEEGFQTRERRIGCEPSLEGCPEAMRQILYALNSHEIVTFLEILTGINGLIPDPHFVGAGLHTTLPGGSLGVHVDFNKHKHLQLDRRVNILIFLNRDWEESYGGWSELWQRDQSACAQRVLPIWNRALIFNTLLDSWHGLPEPVRCPAGMARNAIALYYYSNGRPQEEQSEFFWTRHQKAPTPGRSALKEWAHLLTPPIVGRFNQRLMLKRHAVATRLRRRGATRSAA